MKNEGGKFAPEILHMTDTCTVYMCTSSDEIKSEFGFFVVAKFAKVNILKELSISSEYEIPSIFPQSCMRIHCGSKEEAAFKI